MATDNLRGEIKLANKYIKLFLFTTNQVKIKLNTNYLVLKYHWIFLLDKRGNKIA